jgi:hypothetical protein
VALALLGSRALDRRVTALMARASRSSTLLGGQCGMADGGGMDRDELAAVFYGTGAVPAPWATDCPVRFDVWLAFAPVDCQQVVSSDPTLALRHITAPRPSTSLSRADMGAE